MTHDAPQSQRQRFGDYYAAPRAPWDIGRPQRAFLEAADAIAGRVIDLGCGTGELAIWLAERGSAVTAVDFLAGPLDLAREKAAHRGVAVNFLEMDAVDVGAIPERFDAATDCGLFHTFDDEGRRRYVSALARLLEPGARLFLLCFSTAEPGDYGPRRVSERELRDTFAAGWDIERVQQTFFEIVPGILDADIGPEGARALFAVIRRV